MKKRMLNLLVVLFIPVLLVITNAPAHAAPVVVATADPASGAWPLTVQFGSDVHVDPGTTITGYWWYFADGYTSAEAKPIHTYNCYGTFPAQLTVTDDTGATSTSTITITAQQVMFSSSVALTPVVKYQKSKTTSPISGTVTGTVGVKDTEGYLVGGATVQATWTTPSGTVNQTATTDGSGTATFSVNIPKGGSGTYALVVTNVSKADFIYDSTVGSLSASVLIH